MFHNVKTVEEAWELSQHFKNIRELRNHAKVAYRKLKENGLLQKRYPNSARKAVLQFTIDGVFIKEWATASDASRGLGMDIIGGIGLVCKGKKKTAGGFVWKYKDNSNGE